jgi:lipoteichoic acid synthase
MEEGQVSDELPLYIVHGGIDKDSVWTGPCNQLDVYTTLLDMFGINTPWRGLGHSLLNAHYTNSVSEKTQTLSEWIVRSNYFSRYRSAR